MPLNGFSIGHDIAIDVTDPVTNQLVSWPAPTGFMSDPNTKQIVSEPLNSPPLYAELPTGWKGSISFDRRDSSIDDFFVRNEDLYWQGSNLLSGTITETITEQNGTISQYRYTGVAFKLANKGDWKAQDKVPMKVDWVASRCQKVV